MAKTKTLREDARRHILSSHDVEVLAITMRIIEKASFTAESEIAIAVIAGPEAAVTPKGTATVTIMGWCATGRD